MRISIESFENEVEQELEGFAEGIDDDIDDERSGVGPVENKS